MPEIRLQYAQRVRLGSSNVYGAEEVFAIEEWLRNESAQLFAVDDWPLSADSFSLYAEQLSYGSWQTHDVIVRIVLHHFPERVQSGDDNAAKLAIGLAEMLNSEHAVSLRGRVTVGVSLQFTEIAWASA